MTYALKTQDKAFTGKAILSVEGIILPSAPKAEEWALFLDIDGTISDLAPRPEKAFIQPELLINLSKASMGALALISGRSLSSIDTLTAPYRFAAAGQHGLEIRRHFGQSIPARKAADASFKEITQAIERLIADHPRLHMEHKGESIAVHFRAVPEMEPSVIAYLTQLAKRHTAYCLQHGKKVTEIRPRGSDKGNAITSFMQFAPFKGKIPVFAGDDATDERGFEAVNALNGITIKVGDEPSLATYRAETPEHIRNWLQDILPFLIPATGRNPYE